MQRHPRICLLKGCEKWFCPFRHSARYCSQACRDAARRWSRWRAARRYRTSVSGRGCRREQARRYRERLRLRRENVGEEPAACEGHQEVVDAEKIPCSRPGCYELFLPEQRSPLKRFCSCLCREALRYVRQREARLRPPRNCTSIQTAESSFTVRPTRRLSVEYCLATAQGNRLSSRG
jgi:hypothetical protein